MCSNNIAQGTPIMICYFARSSYDNIDEMLATSCLTGYL